MKKAFQLGIVIGRFQTFHNGHKDIIDKALELCEEVGVFVGSSQESGTYKNPFSYDVRKHLLELVYGDKLKIFPLPDIGAGNNSTWGDYVLENIINRFGKSPDLLVSGKESRRIDWFDSVNGVKIAELYIPKTIEISATEMRGFFIDNDFEKWQKFTPPSLHNEFDSLRQTVILSQDNKETSSI